MDEAVLCVIYPRRITILLVGGHLSCMYLCSHVLDVHVIYAKKTEDRRFQGNQSLAHGNILFERYVFESVRVAYFFTHSREAPSLKDRAQYEYLA